MSIENILKLEDYTKKEDFYLFDVPSEEEEDAFDSYTFSSNNGINKIVDINEYIEALNKKRAKKIDKDSLAYKKMMRELLQYIKDNNAKKDTLEVYGVILNNCEYCNKKNCLVYSMVNKKTES